MTIGWIKLHRKIMDSKYYFVHEKRPATVCEAWIDLLLLANYESKNWLGLPCNRGELLYSQEWYADRWKWTKSKVRRWFKSLEKDKSIIKTNFHKTVSVKILNYGTYQDSIDEYSSDTEPTPTKETKSNKQEAKNGLRASSTESLRLVKMLLKGYLADDPFYKYTDNELRGWSKTFDHMVNYDKRTYNEIEMVVQYVITNDHWLNQKVNAYAIRNGFESFLAKANSGS